MVCAVNVRHAQGEPRRSSLCTDCNAQDHREKSVLLRLVLVVQATDTVLVALRVPALLLALLLLCLQHGKPKAKLNDTLLAQAATSAQNI
jgi:hypothetical protein